ncbi:MAG: hypothetical protein KC503_19385, partial [Myxococcales bacterium]|nr:hypothetical protein [Myxococcales bacterium]
PHQLLKVDDERLDPLFNSSLDGLHAAKLPLTRLVGNYPTERLPSRGPSSAGADGSFDAYVVDAVQTMAGPALNVAAILECPKCTVKSRQTLTTPATNLMKKQAKENS